MRQAWRHLVAHQLAAQQAAFLTLVPGKFQSPGCCVCEGWIVREGGQVREREGEVVFNLLGFRGGSDDPPLPAKLLVWTS